ncbi:MAG TPA: M23 family metallopeptidase [Treponemataceae bacterium]|nr:M23 family metallopeptidase [Treponemataceae bacterium]
MAKTRRYKRLEKNVVQRIFSLIGGFFKLIGRGLMYLFKLCDRKLTIMIVPHSQNKVVNFQTNIFSVVIGSVLVLGIISSFFYFNRQSIGSAAEISRLQNENRQTLASLDELRDENNNLLQAAQRFQKSLSQSLSLIGINQISAAESNVQTGDLSSLFNNKSIVQGSVNETADVRNLTAYLEGAVQPVEQIGKMLETQGDIFADTPSIWPIRGGIGHVSMTFGQNVHPITGRWYIHKGIDLSTWRSGDSVLATANGQIVTVTYDPSFGNYIIIKHAYGYYTRYAHLKATYVKKGQFVSQGDSIGAIGNSGISTGPHLHYEVHIGSDVVDPAKYINIKVNN